ncbi:MAG TPA: lysophospholipid acyltransferase family protein [Myxococcota bacterium]|nr:lysophospholipid acyltransferase family protein [Myxococcota bacterium]
MARDPYNPPFPLGSPFQQVFYWFAWALMATPWTLMFRWRRGDARRVPRDGPTLLVSNHTSAADPLWIAFWIRRRASFMASVALFRVPVLGSLLPLCGCFPKAKFVSDRASMSTLAERYAAGDVIVLFPEGTRTFDGRTQPVLPGLGRLVKRLDARVVCARVGNGHLYQPRWARYPRWIPIRVSYDEPRTWGEDATVEDINREISEAIRIDLDDAKTDGFCWGFRLAEGLPDYLWACPQCFEPEGLAVTSEDRDCVRCAACGAHWRLDIENRMHGEHPLRVHEAHDRIIEHVGSPPIMDPARHEEDKIVLRGPGALHRLARGGGSERLHAGEVELDAAELRIRVEGEVVWRHQLSELRAVSVEMENRLTLRDQEGLLELEPQGQSSLKWGHFLKVWVTRAA